MAANNESKRKPFSYPELLCRVGALMRGAARRRHGRLRVGELEIDPPAAVSRPPVRSDAPGVHWHAAPADDVRRRRVHVIGFVAGDRFKRLDGS
jgi:hypothetical protein